MMDISSKTLDQFIDELNVLSVNGHGSLPVRVADWNECHAWPNEENVVANIVTAREDYIGARKDLKKPFIMIGKDDWYTQVE